MDRARNLARLDGVFDVLIVGGGATGLGAALDAASRGYRTALLEANDFASGTSSRSTKLLHGGVRYLAQGRLGLVREALAERAILRRIAPHLIGEVTLVVPARAWHELTYYGAGLKLYDLLAGKANFSPSHRLSRAQTLECIPNLSPTGLHGGVRYVDGQFDDARFAIALAQTADSIGAIVLNYVRVTKLLKTADRVHGVVAYDQESQAEIIVSARVVVNATGVDADEVRRLSDPLAERTLAPSRGTHIVLPREILGGTHGFIVPRTEDGRVIFALPWMERTLVGTTDVPTRASAPDPSVSDAEIAYLLAHLNRHLERPAGAAEMLATFAGLRPLLAAGTASGASLSREHAVRVDASGLVSVTGGKWTTYRRMAQHAVDTAARVGGLARAASRTATLEIAGADRTERVQALVATEPELAAPISPRLPYQRAEVVFAARHEMARTVEDVLARRTRAAFLDASAAAAAEPITASLLAREVGRRR